VEWNTIALTNDITLLLLVDVTTAIIMRSACILSKIFLQAWNSYQPHFLEGGAIDLIDKKSPFQQLTLIFQLFTRRSWKI
jgi:hypothetical protein